MSIRLSKKHGVNPTLLVCPICGQETGEIALLGELKDGAEAPRYTMSNNLCKECQEHIDSGHALILEVEDLAIRGDYRRTGRYLIVNKEAINNPHSIVYCKHTDYEKILQKQKETNQE